MTLPVSARREVLSLSQARALHLAAQGLLHPPVRRARREDVVTAITRMRMLQIDSIHVVARSPYLVLFSRLGGYPQEWLDEALADGRLFECWAHEACFAPSGDFPLHEAARSLRERHWAFRSAHRMRREHGSTLHKLLEQVREQGPLRAGELEKRQPRTPGWWEWSIEKKGLEALFALGDVMVARRERFQRVYDVTERVLSNMAVPDSEAWTPDRARMCMTADAIRALGIARPSWVGDYHRQGRVPDSLLQALIDQNEVLQVEVRGWDGPALVHRDHASLLGRVAAGRLRATHSTLLSPFDPVVWDRTRARELFDFDYALECYTPTHKRRYGYFVLPLLHRGRLVARVDAKAHRREGVFEVRALHMEAGVRASDGVLRGIAKALRNCALWHRTPHVVVTASDPATIRTALEPLLSRPS
ncbi:crosslink repair DNA glycosylase YcaQ family protein [Oleiagrimonas sp. MCCC 1A03011]|uniref:winged helix-turn-helix domain-containing protein n=1 Tax=Oleiagrimonas sp. MCCC 1A03011 TaxID=1926883 RepID=UPI000DC23DC4|nr:crosslink repair DNA glycosylase YcaQ family protein [Oleiagrimonas sp. MCCC 1A03011]RAP57734.1 hypothetical protein BTJ49_07520 [Oleiagrimonas sp. MCCC 1A03011]